MAIIKTYETPDTCLLAVSRAEGQKDPVNFDPRARDFRFPISDQDTTQASAED
jgi:hypothetical protein